MQIAKEFRSFSTVFDISDPKIDAAARSFLFSRLSGDRKSTMQILVFSISEPKRKMVDVSQHFTCTDSVSAERQRVPHIVREPYDATTICSSGVYTPDTHLHGTSALSALGAARVQSGFLSQRLTFMAGDKPV